MKTMWDSEGVRGLQLRRGMHVASTRWRRDVGVCRRVYRQTFWCGAGGCGAVLVGWLRVRIPDRVMVVGWWWGVIRDNERPVAAACSLGQKQGRAKGECIPGQTLVGCGGTCYRRLFRLT